MLCFRDNPFPSWRSRGECALVGGRAVLSPTVGLGFTNADMTLKVNACARAPGCTFLWPTPLTRAPTYVSCYVIYLGISVERQAWVVGSGQVLMSFQFGEFSNSTISSGKWRMITTKRRDVPDEQGLRPQLTI